MAARTLLLSLFLLAGCRAKPLVGAEEVALVDGVACARMTDGSVSCWGRGLGSKAVAVRGLGPATRIVAEGTVVCTLGVDTRVRCAEVKGMGKPDPKALVVVDQGWVSIEEIVSGEGICARNRRSVVCRSAWSARTAEVVTDRRILLPEDVVSLVAARGVVAGLGKNGRLTSLDGGEPLVEDAEHKVSADNGGLACVRRRTGATACAGSFSMPFSAVRAEPMHTLDFPELRDLEDIGAGPSHACARRGSEVLCSGANDFGQLGDGSTVSERSAFSVVPLSGPAKQVAISVPAGDLGGSGPLHPGKGINVRSFACAVLTSGMVECWGYNNQGQLGDGSTTSRDRPVQVLTTK